MSDPNPPAKPKFNPFAKPLTEEQRQEAVASAEATYARQHAQWEIDKAAYAAREAEKSSKGR